MESKRLKIAYVKNHIEWDRYGIFDKYLIQALLEHADVDIYTGNIPHKHPEDLLNCTGKFKAFKFSSFGPTALTYIHVWWKMRKIEKKYDYMITDWEFYNVANALLNSSKSLIYFQTPERSFYDLHEYRVITKKNVFRRIIQYVWNCQKIIDNYVIRNNTKALIFGNSNNVAKRIYKTYLKDAVVVYPAPANRKRFGVTPIKSFPFAGKKYYITVSRIIPEKRLEIMINAFKKLKNENLVIVGWLATPKYYEKIKKLSATCQNIIFIDKLDDASLNWLYANAQATILTPLDEDYGMVPSESMEMGTPVIAAAEGGYMEIIIPKFNGEFIIQPYESNLIAAIKSHDKKNYDSAKMQQFIKEKLGYEAFSKNLWNYINEHHKKQIGNRAQR